MPITKPPSIESDPFKSAKWDELTQGRTFTQSNAPALALLCSGTRSRTPPRTSWTTSAVRPRTATTSAT